MTQQLESLDNLLTDKRLQVSLGTWRTDLRSIPSEIFIRPFPAIGEKLPSAIRTFLFPG